MIARILVFVSLLSIPLLSLADNENSTYYSVRPDYRKCASPLCGGVFVQRVNRPSTRCADGRLQGECYVATIDLSALKLSADQEAAARLRIETGTTLLKGRLHKIQYDLFGPLGEFTASELWEAASDGRPSGPFFRTTDQGIVCITTPCQSFAEFKLNSRSQRAIAGVDLSRVGASDKLVAAAYTATQMPEGILVAGRHRPLTGPADRAAELVASQFYLMVTTDKPQSCFVGGCSSELCGDNPDMYSFCIWRPEFSCYGAEKAITRCERQADDRCGWTPTAQLQQCLNETTQGATPGSLAD